MTALNYLSYLPAYFINLERSEDRADHMMRSFSPLVKELYRVPAIDGPATYTDQEMLAWRDNTMKLIAADRDLPPDERLVGQERSGQASHEHLLRNEKSRRLYKATMGSFKSHILAIAQAVERIESGNEQAKRFLILEDDAVPRVKYLRTCAAPPRAGELNVWGGALQMGAWKADLAQLANRRALRWELLPPSQVKVRRQYISMAYELSYSSASRFLEIIQQHQMQYDAAWWFAMMQLKTYRLRPSGMQQANFASVRR